MAKEFISCEMGVGCFEHDKCYAEAQGKPEKCAARHDSVSGIREEYMEQVIAWILKDSMADAKGDQTIGVALALKRVFIAAFKTGQDAPKPLH